MKIKLNSINKTIEIKKAPFKTFIEIMKVVEEIPQQLSKFTSENTFQVLPKIIAGSYDDFKKIISLVIKIDGDEVDLLYFDEVVAIVKAIISENEIIKIIDDLKKNNLKKKQD